MSAFSVYWISGELHHDLKVGFCTDDESQLLIGAAVVHVGHYNGVGALVVISAGETDLIMADGIPGKGVV